MIVSGAADDTYTIGGIRRQQVRVGDPVTCGKHEGLYLVAGGMGDTYSVDGASKEWAGSLDSISSCPCRARFVPSVDTHAYESNCNAGRAAENARAAEKALLPAYLTGEKTEAGFTANYPILRNTHDCPDKNLRNMLKTNNHDVMLLTPMEAFEVLQSWGWKDAKTQWVETTQSDVGQVLVSYGVNVKDVVTTSMVIARLGDFGIKATLYINHKGTELIKLSGYPGIRKILNAPVFAAKNPKVVDLGIGKYGMGKSIVEGTRLTFYVAAAYRTLDFILNDETSLAAFIGSLATDVVKLGIASAISWGGGILVATLTGIVAVNLGVVLFTGIGAALALQHLDKKFGLTDNVIAHLEKSQQEFVEKARELEGELLDMGAMYADHMLDKGKRFFISEIKKYAHSKITEIIPRTL